MKVHKFEGATMRDALAKVKAELGDQAVIISTRQLRKGLLGSAVEISAAIEDADEPAFTSSSLSTSATASRGPSDAEIEKVIAPLRTELRSLRALVRASSDNRGASELRGELAALRRLVEELRTPATGTAPTAPAARPMTSLVAPSTGKVLVLVGPTGAGKTTTIAKLAARAALIEQRNVHLITTDNYRVGGVDQIRAFADLIGVPLAVADAPSSVARLIDPSAELTLVDTAGRSPRDTASVAELASALERIPGVEVHLVAPAAMSAQALDELVARYRPLSPARLLFTKVDEVEIAPELSQAPTRHRLPITWVTTGQQVPEDIEEPTAARVVELASRGVNAMTTKAA